MPPSTSGRRDIRRIENLGYVVKLINGILLMWRVDLPARRRHAEENIAELRAEASDGRLDVLFISTKRDWRSRSTKPYASDILLGFWKHTISMPVSSLQILAFQHVTEPGVCDAVAQVYQDILRLPAPSCTIEITTNEQQAFGLLLATSFGKIATHMLSKYTETPGRAFGFKIVPVQDMSLQDMQSLAGIRLRGNQITNTFHFEVHFC